MEQELVHWIKKIQGKYERQKGIQTFPTANDHSFTGGTLDFDDSGGTVTVDSFINSIKVPSDSDAEAKVNLDRPVTDDEYTPIFPGTIKEISRNTSTIYVKAPAGRTCKVRIETLEL